MKNFEFLFAAWMAVWAVFLVYEVSVASRMSQLRDDIERLKQQLREGSVASARRACSPRRASSADFQPGVAALAFGSLLNVLRSEILFSG